MESKHRGKPFSLFPVLFILSALLLLSLSFPAQATEKEQLSVTRDKDKTVYSIGSDDTSRKEEERKQERSWEMLKNMPIIVDRPVNTDKRAPEPRKK